MDKISFLFFVKAGRCLFLFVCGTEVASLKVYGMLFTKAQTRAKIILIGTGAVIFMIDFYEKKVFRLILLFYCVRGSRSV
jgi:hypothetical protein